MAQGRAWRHGQRREYRRVVPEGHGPCAPTNRHLQRRCDEAAKAEVMPRDEPHRGKGLNHRAENSHQPTRGRQRRLRGFKSPRQAPRFFSTFGMVVFPPGRHVLCARNDRAVMRRRLFSHHPGQVDKAELRHHFLICASSTAASFSCVNFTPLASTRSSSIRA